MEPVCKGRNFDTTCLCPNHRQRKVKAAVFAVFGG